MKRQRPVKLSAEEKAERDARQQKWLNRLKMAQVKRAADRAGWYDVPVQFLIDGGALIEDYGDRIEFVVPDDGRYRVVAYDGGATVNARKIG